MSRLYLAIAMLTVGAVLLALTLGGCTFLPRPADDRPVMVSHGWLYVAKSGACYQRVRGSQIGWVCYL